MKKILFKISTGIIAGVMMLLTILPVSISASAINGDFEIVELDSSFIIDNFEITYEIDEEQTIIEVENLETNETSTAIINLERNSVILPEEQKEIVIEEENVFHEADSIISNQANPYSYAPQSIKTFGPYRTNFSISAVSGTALVATVAAISALLNAGAAAGLTAAIIKAGVTAAWNVIKAAFAAFIGNGNLKVTGYFQYSQQTRNNGTQARNINRMIYLTVSDRFNSKSATHSFGNGSWFNTVRPY